MAFGSEIYGYLSGVSGVTNIVSTRIYPVRLPDAPTLEAIVYTVISAPRTEDLSGSSGLGTAIVQIDCWANTYSEANTLAEAVRQAMQGYSGTMGGTTVEGVHLLDELDNFEEDINERRKILRFSIWFRETKPSF